MVNGSTTESFTYDDDGNMLTNGAWTYAYNGENRMTTAENGTKRLEYIYDYQGRRVEKKEFDNSTLIKHTKFVYDGNNVVAEYEDNTLSKKYLWGEDVSGSMAGAGGVGALLVVNDTTEDYYSMYDGNGNIVKYVNETSNEVASFEYTPFGAIKSASGSMVDELHYRFSTKYFDNNTNLIVYRYRNYNPQTGKWQTRDPLGEFTEQKQFNLLYGFVTNNPILYFDYLGNWKYKFRGTWKKSEKMHFVRVMMFAAVKMKQIQSKLEKIVEKHEEHNAPPCKCPIHNHLDGIKKTISIFKKSLDYFYNDDILNVYKRSLGNKFAVYAKELYHSNAYMKVDKESFFKQLPFVLPTCIHEISHAGGSEDYLDKNGGAIPKWDNAHIIEDIYPHGIKAFKPIIDLTKCTCECNDEEEI
ncbi:RHS repeat-associated core domain-containing protein [Lentisphaerota bacterium WC36G]|nr:RHS repeat-associated core domain-containing protein [Lentisphaerae bacterium WC36]